MNQIEELVEEFAPRVLSGEMEFDQMRKVMMERNISEDTIRTVISVVDDLVIYSQTAKSAIDQQKRIRVLGRVLTIFGVGFSLISFLGAFDTSYTSIRVFMYGPLLSGLSIMLYGRFKPHGKPYESVRNRRKFMSKRGQ